MITNCTAQIPHYLELRHLSRIFGNKPAVDDLTLGLQKGELFVLLGPSGCGKTTTLRLLAGLETPTRGEIYLDGQCLNGIGPRDRNVGMVFQERTLYPHMRVAENLAFGLKMQGVARGEIRERVAEMAAVLGLEEHLTRWPHQLSGGEAQRVALGKALIRRPDLLLLDEPMSDLDLPLRRKLREEIRRLQRRYAITTIHVTHDQEEAMSLGDRMGIMEGGRLLQVGTPKQIYEDPNCLFSAQFLGTPAINLIPAQVDSGDERVQWSMDWQILSPPWNPGAAAGYHGPVWVAVRPEDILVSRRPKSPPEIMGTVEFVQDMGFEYHVMVTIGGIGLRVRCSHLPEGIEEGAEVHMKLRHERMLLFRQDTGERVVTTQKT